MPSISASRILLIGATPTASSVFSAVEFNTIPEPSSVVALCGLGAMGLFLLVRRRLGVSLSIRTLGKGLACTVALLGCSYFSTANAANVDAFVSQPKGTFTTRTDTLAQAGFGFYANTSGTQQVDELGFWVSPADSGNTGKLAVSHQVALYDFNGSTYTEIASGTVAAGSTADSNGYAWVNIPTVTLTDIRQHADYYIVMASEGTDFSAPLTGSANTTVLDTSFGTVVNGWASGSAFPGWGTQSTSAAITSATGVSLARTSGLCPSRRRSLPCAALAWLA